MANNLVVQANQRDGTQAGAAGNTEAALFETETVRVSDLTGEMRAQQSLSRAPVVSPALRGGKLALTWYDWAVVVLILASLAAGIVCLLRGV